MKKTIFAIIFIICAFSFDAVEVYSDGISAKAAIVYEPMSQTVLYEKSADDRMLVASTTKIMTALIVLENCTLEENVSVKSEHTKVEGSSMYLRCGGEYTVEDLLHGLMLASGNDAPAALADHVAGSMEDFAALMNEKCRELSLENTHFENAHGLDGEDHYSSARDLALLTAAAMENESFCRIFSCASYSVDGKVYHNHNKLLDSLPGCIGGKTGYTKKAGRVLVSCVERESMRLICVTISDPDDWKDHAELYDKLFAEYKFIPLLESVEDIPLVSGERKSVELCSSVAGAVISKNSDAEIIYHLPRFVFAPVRAGDRAGYAEITGAGGLSRIIDIYYGKDVSRIKR